MVRLFRYPSFMPNSAYHEFKGHYGHITNLQFANEDKHLVSVGGSDKTVMIWQLNDLDYETKSIENLTNNAASE